MRKLASIQKIKYINPIPNADNIVVAGVLGWECVCKKDEFKINDKCVYFEIDSLLPDVPQFEFLRKSCWNKNLNKYRIKTVKLRKQLSQGLALPIELFPEIENFEIGSDVTEILNVEKYEPPIPPQISGDAVSFSWPISKTDETRIQQNDEYNFIEKLKGKPYYISLKLDGTSCSFIINPHDNLYHVCGRNYSYKENEGHNFWVISKRYQIEENLRKLWDKNIKIALQGECVGPGIQKNPLGLDLHDIFIFNVIDVLKNKKLPIEESLKITEELNLKFVPIIEKGENFQYNEKELLEKAKGKYIENFKTAKASTDREGLVVRSTCGTISFKCINNDFLLKN